jgi:hypothetical protein
MIAFTLFFFSLYHLYLIGQGITTNEHLRNKWRRQKNPFDKGFATNLKKEFCPPKAPISYILNPREEFTNEFEIFDRERRDDD